MTQRFLVLGAVITSDSRVHIRKLGHHVTRALFAFQLNKPASTGDEFTTVFGDRRSGKFGVFAIGLGVSHGHVGNPKCTHILSSNHGFGGGNRCIRIVHILGTTLGHVRATAAALATQSFHCGAHEVNR